MQETSLTNDNESAVTQLVVDDTQLATPASASAASVKKNRTEDSNRKKQHVNANYLLNFSLPPRQQVPSFHTPLRKGKPYSPYNKERYVNANFRFVVSSLGYYESHVVDPDAMVAWSDVEQVIVPCTVSQSCPICLSSPQIAPKVTRCGHVFCYACILRYLAMGEKKYRTCPICYDNIYAKDLKSAKLIMVRDFSRWTEAAADDGCVDRALSEFNSKSSKVLMKLFTRSSGSINALPRVYWGDWALTELPVCESDRCVHLSYSKIIMASSNYITNFIIADEKLQLVESLKEAKSCREEEGAAFLESALQQLEQRLEQLILTKLDRDTKFNRAKYSQLNSPGRVRSVDTFVDDNFSLPEGALSQESQKAASSQQLDSAVTSDYAPSRSPSLHPAPTSTRRRSMHSPNTAASDGQFYFYQSSDSQLLYLHPLDVKILKDEYGSYERLPDEICVKISVIEESTLTEEVRKRYKYLSHLPVSCDVSFLEIDWSAEAGSNICRNRVTASTATSPLVSPTLFAVDKSPRNESTSSLIQPATLKKWSADIKARDKRRRDKLRNEEKKEKKEERRRLNSSSHTDSLATPNSTKLQSSQQISTEPDPFLAPSPLASSEAPIWVPAARPIFNFEDTTDWAPLASQSVSKISPVIVQQETPLRSSDEADSPETVDVPVSPIMSLKAESKNGVTEADTNIQPPIVKKNGKGKRKAVVVVLMSTATNSHSNRQ